MALESALRGPFQIPSSLHLLRWASLGVGIWHWGWQDRKEKQVWRLVVGWEGWVEKRGFRIFQILLRSYKLPKKRRKKRTCIIYQTHHRHWAGPLHRLSPLGLISSQQHKHCYTHFTEMGPENQGSESSSVCKKSRSRWVAQQRLPLCVLWTPWTLFTSSSFLHCLASCSQEPEFRKEKGGRAALLA